MSYSLLALFTIAISVLVLSSSFVQAVGVTDYADSVLSVGDLCSSTAKARTVSVSPCRSDSPTGQTIYDVSTSQGKLAIIADGRVSVLAHKKVSVLVPTTIRGGTVSINQSVFSYEPDSVASVVRKSSALGCERGRGAVAESLDLVYKNASRESVIVCYDSFVGEKFFETVQDYQSVSSTKSVSSYVPIDVTIKKAGTQYAYDLGVSEARVSIGWESPDKTGWFGRKATKKWYAIGYSQDLASEFESMSATVLDPYFDVDWSSRFTINLTCPASAVGDQRCFFNDSMIIQLDTADLVSRGQLQADGDDLRIVFRNDSADVVQTEIASYNLTGFNQVNTSLLFRLQNSVVGAVALGAGVVNTSYYVYTNNGAATIPSYRTDISTVYDRGGLNHNMTDVMMCMDFDNETGEATDIANSNGRVYNRCKTGIIGVSPATEISFNSTLAVDLEPNVNVIGSFPNISSMGALGRSVSFNSASARCLITQDAAAFNFANYTMSAWVKMNASGNLRAIIDSVGNNVLMGTDANGDVRCYSQDGAASVDVSTDEAFEIGIWNFVSCVYHNNGTMTAYLGNSTGLKKIKSLDGAGGTIDDWAGGIAIGNRPPCTGTTNVFTGSIDDVFIFNASLEQNEIAMLYNRTRVRWGGSVTFVYGAHENSSNAPVIVLNSTTVLPNGTTSIALNETKDVMVNVTYTSDAGLAGNDGNLSVRFSVNNTNVFNQTVLLALVNRTYQFNLSNTTFGRNATIYFNVSAVDNTSRSASDVTSQNVTVRNIPPGAVTNITIAGSSVSDGLRTRQNFTINWNQTGDDDDPLSNLGFNTTVGGVGYCGRKNVTTSCQIALTQLGTFAYTITTLDGENATSTSSATIIIDESAPSLDNITNVTVQETSFVLNWTTNETTNYSVAYSNDCASLSSLAVGTSFNTSVSRQIIGLAADTFYCYRITVGDNITSPLGHFSTVSALYNVTTAANPGNPEQGDILIPSGGGGGGGTTVRVEGEFVMSPAVVGKFRFVGLGGEAQSFVQDFLVSQKPSSCESLNKVFSCEITSTGVRASMISGKITNELVSVTKDTIKTSLQSLQDTSEISVTTINLGVFFETGSSFGISSSLFAALDEQGNPLGIKIVPVLVVLLALVVLGVLLSSGRSAARFARDVVGGR